MATMLRVGVLVLQLKRTNRRRNHRPFTL